MHGANQVWVLTLESVRQAVWHETGSRLHRNAAASSSGILSERAPSCDGAHYHTKNGQSNTIGLSRP